MTTLNIRNTIRILSVISVSLASSDAAGFSSGILRKPDSWFGTDEGKQTTACVISWQTEGGAWPKNGDTSKTLNPGGSLEGTFDNKATTDELRYLARAYKATNDMTCKAAFLKGFDCILKAQYPNGGWPQLYPLGKKAYPHHITFNDNSMVRLLQLLGEVTGGDLYSFVDADRLSAARKAIDRGIGCILKCQIIIDGKPTVWCAQHDEVTFAPARARAYELPSLSGSESEGIVRYLMSIKDPSPEVIRSVKAAAAWYESSKITGIRIVVVNGDRQVVADPSAPPQWARFYDLETGRPFFCDRDGVKKSRLSEIGKERRNGYAWYGTWGGAFAKEYAKWPHH